MAYQQIRTLFRLLHVKLFLMPICEKKSQSSLSHHRHHTHETFSISSYVWTELSRVHKCCSLFAFVCITQVSIFKKTLNRSLVLIWTFWSTAQSHPTNRIIQCFYSAVANESEIISLGLKWIWITQECDVKAFQTFFVCEKSAAVNCFIMIVYQKRATANW